ncbi:MAG TPA: TetR/AcrR family transcriptional regulator [Symbiobacteriaceae bacterium]|nr:TetR/AcrR family transcriptional regulator [Symbiobacteriaceae bacterium]
MARSVNPAEHAARRGEILDGALQLILTRGYADMSIQDLLDRLRISRGAFYHYFDSKEALLEALTERLHDEVEQHLAPIVQDPQASALEKLQRFLGALLKWKNARKGTIKALLPVWYSDENAIFLKKMQETGVARTQPLMAALIRQGVAEGVLSPPYPDQACDVFFSLRQGLQDTLARLLLAPGPLAIDQITGATDAYTAALEQALGAPRDSLRPMTTAALKEWLIGEET